MVIKNILVFPCGSEIGLEIRRSMKYSAHFKLIGGSSVNDHGRFVFDNYIGGIPFHRDSYFIKDLVDIVKKHRIDAIYPTMDAVAVTIKENEHKFGCRVIGSSVETVTICASKAATYTRVEGHIPLPKWCEEIDGILTYPVFIKPDAGYGSRHVYLANNKIAAQEFISKRSSDVKYVYCEYLPGSEYTIDCFSNRHNKLMFAGARVRSRISNGISTNTKIAREFEDLFNDYAERINLVLKPCGAWFFQMKLDKNGNPKLLEIAARLGGSSSLFRSQGVNFALLSTYETFGIDVSLLKNTYETELDRALTNKYLLNIEYHSVYVDFDDCLLIDSKINIELISFIFSAINNGKKIILITKHAGDIYRSLAKYRIADLFDEVICLVDREDRKSNYIEPEGAIFIDDSYTERADVFKKHQIPVFSPDMIETLL